MNFIEKILAITIKAKVALNKEEIITLGRREYIDKEIARHSKNTGVDKKEAIANLKMFYVAAVAAEFNDYEWGEKYVIELEEERNNNNKMPIDTELEALGVKFSKN